MVDEDNPLKFERLGKFVTLSLLERFETEDKMASYLRNSFVLYVYCSNKTLSEYVLVELGEMINEQCTGLVAYEYQESVSIHSMRSDQKLTHQLYLFFEKDHDMSMIKMSDGRITGVLE